MTKINSKKLLILGGSRYILPIIKIAQDMGIYIITADYLPNNIAHKYSDEYVNVSIIDKEAVLKVAREKNVSGVMSFACDPGVTTAAYVAEKLGLPSCGPYESVCILQNKARFRKFLADNGFNVPKAKGFNSITDAMAEINQFRLPIIVKPTDSAGSKGVSKVDKLEDLEVSVRNALRFSSGKEFIIEEFIEKKGCSSDSDSFSVNGKLEFLSFSAQYFDDKSENPYTPSAYCWPATLSFEAIKYLSEEIQRLLKLLNMRTSIYNIETREDVNGVPYIMEVSPRGGGNRLSEMLTYATGVDLLKNSILAALGEEIENVKQKDINGFWAEVILHSSKPGLFDKLTIKKQNDVEIIEEDLWVCSGDSVGGFSGANESIGTLILKFNSLTDMEEYMSRVNENVIVELREEKA